MKDFEGRVAVVTGAASGIGLALSERFAGLGMKVVMADVEPAALDAASKALVENGADVLGVRTDVSQADSVAELAEKTLEHFGKLHVLCNNAGVFTGGVAWEAPLSDFEWVFGVNVWGVLHGIRTFVPILLEQGEPGHIVNTASMAAVTHMPFTSAYTASKHAVLSLSEVLYMDLAQQETKIGVSVLCPELVNTGIGRSERNRPPHLKRPEDAGSASRELTEQAIRASTAGGVETRAMADRVVEAIREERLYVLSEEGDYWRTTANERLDDLRLARNPALAVPDVELPES